MNVAVNVVVNSGKPIQDELLTWLNGTLQTDFTKVEQVCTGRSACRWVFCCVNETIMSYSLIVLSLCILWVCGAWAELSCSCLAS